MLYCGLDLYAKESFLYVIDHRGRNVLVKRVSTQTRSFKESLGPLVKRRLKVVLEASTMTVVILHLDLIVNIESGIFPGEELVD